MCNSHFLLGMSLGVMAGAAAGMMLAPKKKKICRAAEKAMHSATCAMEDLADSLGF